MDPSPAALLARWEQAEDPKAPLSTSQRESINEINAEANIRPIPNEVY